MRVVFLHGFASSARSSKASFLRERLAASGLTIETPDLNEPDFSTLTTTRMLGQVDRLIEDGPSGPIALMGSSLGGFVAVLAALRHPARVDRLVLFAPSLAFGHARMRAPGDPRLEHWKAAGSMDVFHHAYGRVLPVHYALYEDAAQFDAYHADLRMPVLVYQGRRDTEVDPESVGEWAAARANVTLHLLDDDHQLGASFDLMWNGIRAFLGLPGEPGPAATS